MNLNGSTSKWILAGIFAFAFAAFLASGAALFISAQSFRATAAVRAPESAGPSVSALPATYGNAEQTGEVLPPVSVTGQCAPVTSPAESFVAAPVAVVSTARPQAEEAAAVTEQVVAPIAETAAAGNARSQVQNFASHGIVGGMQPKRARAGRPEFAQSPTAAIPDSAENSNTGDEVITAPEGNVAIPVAFQPASGKESDVEKAQLENVQQRFVNDIGGTQQNPSDPDYQATWTKAQQLADERYRALFGEQAFLNRQQWQNTHPDAADAAN